MKSLLFFFRFLGYVIIFFFELVKANLQIARQVLSPHYRFKSVALKFQSKMKTKTELILITNSITLTPGTLVMDANLETGEILVHSMTGESPDKVRKELSLFPEEKVLWVTRGSS